MRVALILALLCGQVVSAACPERPWRRPITLVGGAFALGLLAGNLAGGSKRGNRGDPGQCAHFVTGKEPLILKFEATLEGCGCLTVEAFFIQPDGQLFSGTTLTVQSNGRPDQQQTVIALSPAETQVGLYTIGIRICAASGSTTAGSNSATLEVHSPHFGSSQPQVSLTYDDVDDLCQLVGQKETADFVSFFPEEVLCAP